MFLLADDGAATCRCISAGLSVFVASSPLASIVSQILSLSLPLPISCLHLLSLLMVSALTFQELCVCVCVCMCVLMCISSEFFWVYTHIYQAINRT